MALSQKSGKFYFFDHISFFLHLKQLLSLFFENFNIPSLHNISKPIEMLPSELKPLN